MRKSAGFTLIEVLVAMMILVGAILILTSSWSGNFARIRKARLYNNVSVLLERKLAEVEAKNNGKKLTEISDEEGDFGSEYPDYRWSVATQAFEMPDISAMLTRDGASQLMLTILSTMRESMSQAIMEITVTVYVKAGQKEIPFSVTTYHVDFTSNIKLPGVGG